MANGRRPVAGIAGSGAPLTIITAVFFVEAVGDENRTRYETPYQDAATGVMIEPVLVTTVE